MLFFGRINKDYSLALLMALFLFQGFWFDKILAPDSVVNPAPPGQAPISSNLAVASSSTVSGNSSSFSQSDTKSSSVSASSDTALSKSDNVSVSSSNSSSSANSSTPILASDLHPDQAHFLMLREVSSRQQKNLSPLGQLAARSAMVTEAMRTKIPQITAPIVAPRGSEPDASSTTKSEPTIVVEHEIPKKPDPKPETKADKKVDTKDDDSDDNDSVKTDSTADTVSSDDGLDDEPAVLDEKDKTDLIKSLAEDYFGLKSTGANRWKPEDGSDLAKAVAPESDKDEFSDDQKTAKAALRKIVDSLATPDSVKSVTPIVDSLNDPKLRELISRDDKNLGRRLERFGKFVPRGLEEVPTQYLAQDVFARSVQTALYGSERDKKKIAEKAAAEADLKKKEDDAAKKIKDLEDEVVSLRGNDESDAEQIRKSLAEIDRLKKLREDDERSIKSLKDKTEEDARALYVARKAAEAEKESAVKAVDSAYLEAERQKKLAQEAQQRAEQERSEMLKERDEAIERAAAAQRQLDIIKARAEAAEASATAKDRELSEKQAVLERLTGDSSATVEQLARARAEVERARADLQEAQKSSDTANAAVMAEKQKQQEAAAEKAILEEKLKKAAAEKDALDSEAKRKIKEAEERAMAAQAQLDAKARELEEVRKQLEQARADDESDKATVARLMEDAKKAREELSAANRSGQSTSDAMAQVLSKIEALNSQIALMQEKAKKDDDAKSIVSVNSSAQPESPEIKTLRAEVARLSKQWQTAQRQAQQLSAAMGRTSAPPRKVLDADERSIFTDQPDEDQLSIETEA